MSCESPPSQPCAHVARAHRLARALSYALSAPQGSIVLCTCRERRPRTATPLSPPRTSPFPAALLPIAMLLDEMKSEDVEARINAMRKLQTVAAALGPERTKKELIPFLAGACLSARRAGHV
jgi:hypothetical protein